MGKKEACGILRTTAEELHLVATGERDITKRKKILVVKQQQQNLMTRFRTTIETIEEAVGNDAVEATEAWKEVMEQLLRDV